MHGCQRCGRLDSSLRGTGFGYAVSLLVVTFRRPGSFGVFCSRCRKKEAFKYSLVSGLFGWWGIPWGPIYTLQTIGQNSAGGLQNADLNADLLAAVGAELADRGEVDEAAKSLEASLELRDQPEVRQFLWALQGAHQPRADEVTTGVSHTPRDELDSDAVGARATSGRLPSLSPGDIVSWSEVTPLRKEPTDDSDVVASLSPDQAVVTRTSGHWAHVRTINGQDGWLPAQILSQSQ